jgi:hypothetical protein
MLESSKFITYTNYGGVSEENFGTLGVSERGFTSGRVTTSLYKISGLSGLVTCMENVYGKLQARGSEKP